MPKAEARKKRPYMPSHQRHRALLDAAAEIVGRSGWSALTMKGLAADAGVSRQLVYDHFEDGAGLFVCTIKHLFESSYRATAEVLQDPTGDVPSTVREAFRIFLDLPVAQRRALRALMADFGPEPPEARSAIALMREQILSLWVPYARRQTGLAERELRPMVWMLNAAAWGLTDLVDDGSLGKEEARDLLANFAAQMLVSGRAPRGRRSAAAPVRPRKRRYSGKGDRHE
jgi:AcrR family transcriptional regulator